MASISRLLMSFPVSSRLTRSLHDFHFSSLSLDIWNSSFLVSFTFRFRFWWVLGTVALEWLMRCIAVEAHHLHISDRFQNSCLVLFCDSCGHGVDVSFNFMVNLVTLQGSR